SAFPVPSTIQTTSDRRPNPQRSTPANVSGAGKSPNSTTTAEEPSRRSSGNRSTTNAANSPKALNPQPTAVALPILRQGMQGPAIAHLQERLRALGFFKGSVDGVFGAATQTAVKAAQQSFKLTPDGIVGSATWSALLR
ncbi:MAG TPA: peptidoglycan-binding protein, partial [Cyanobacteria bacterium UBA8543]|nr:peptidoglycan-binding protein [Cyanobacteria bacterium UBA8543]